MTNTASRDGATTRGSRERASIGEALTPDPVIEAYKRGVDRSILRHNLSCSVEERLAILQQMVALSEEFKRARDSAGGLGPAPD